MRRVQKVFKEFVTAAVILKQSLARDKAKRRDDPAAGITDRCRDGARKRLNVGDGDGIAALANFLQILAQYVRIGYRDLSQLFERAPQILFDKFRRLKGEQHSAF